MRPRPHWTSSVRQVVPPKVEATSCRPKQYIQTNQTTRTTQTYIINIHIHIATNDNHNNTNTTTTTTTTTATTTNDNHDSKHEMTQTGHCPPNRNIHNISTTINGDTQTQPTPQIRFKSI